MTANALTITQAAIGIVALVGITVLGATGSVSSDALVAIYSAVIGAALGTTGHAAIVRAKQSEDNNGNGGGS